MKAITFYIGYLADYMKFCKLCELRIESQHVDATMQDSNVHLLVCGMHDEAMSKAKDSFLISGYFLVTLYGLFNNTPEGIKRLKEAAARDEINESSQLQSISATFK